MGILETLFKSFFNEDSVKIPLYVPTFTKHVTFIIVRTLKSLNQKQK